MKDLGWNSPRVSGSPGSPFAPVGQTPLSVALPLPQHALPSSSTWHHLLFKTNPAALVEGLGEVFGSSMHTTEVQRNQAEGVTQCVLCPSCSRACHGRPTGPPKPICRDPGEQKGTRQVGVQATGSCTYVSDTQRPQPQGAALQVAEQPANPVISVADGAGWQHEVPELGPAPVAGLGDGLPIPPRPGLSR